VSAARFMRVLYAQVEEHELVLSSLILALVVILAYGEIVFLGYTLSPATFSPGVLSFGPYGYYGRRIAQWHSSMPGPLASRSFP